MALPTTTRKCVLNCVSIAAIAWLFPMVASAQLEISPPSSVSPASPPPAATIAPAVDAVTVRPFVGTVTADKVYVRSGPDTKFYELGQLSRGDTVQVTESRNGWYKILPPNGVYCMIAKEYLELDAGGGTGTVKGDHINVRAGSALYKNLEPWAILTTVRKGTRLTVLGATDKYYEIAPPEKACVYVSSQFVTEASADTAYAIPTLKLRAGATGPNRATVTSVPAVFPTATVEVVEEEGEKPEVVVVVPPATPSTTPPTASSEASAASAETVPVVAPKPAFSADVYKRYDELNVRYQAELRKPVGTRELGGLIADYKALLASKESLPASVVQGGQARLADLEKLATVQRLQKENAASAAAIDAQRRVYQDQAKTAEAALKAYENSGDYLAEGVLQTAAVVPDKYALVNPATGRTVAYVDPKSAIDIASLLGKYIGVRGSVHKAAGTEMEVIQVKTATLIEAPK